ncbi:MAG: flavin reductase family protein [Candidatus Acidiferrales bacterium]
MFEEQTISYRRLFGRFATGVAVILAEHGGKVVGMTVNSLTSASLNPPLLLFCARIESQSGESILRAGRFSANILTAHQEAVARHFAARGAVNVEFECVRDEDFIWLARSNAVFRCEVEVVHPAGDHRIILGRVLNMLGPEGCNQLLVYHEGHYAKLDPRTRNEIPTEIDLS